MVNLKLTRPSPPNHRRRNSSELMGRPDPASGFCPDTRTFYSLRPPVSLPPENTPLSAATYALSLQFASPRPDCAALIHSSTGQRISYSQFRRYVKTLAFSLRTELGLCKGDVALVVSPNSTSVPILYFALLSIGVAVSPANPLSTSSEISRQIIISKPAVAFATSATALKLPKQIHKTILIDSDEFENMMMAGEFSGADVSVSQDDVAAILYSSGTTGQVKGVAITHRNFIAITAAYYHRGEERSSPAVWLHTMPYFHVFGFFFSFKSVALAETVVVMERFELGKMLQAVEKFKVTDLAVVPPIVVAMVKNNDLTEKHDLGSLVAVGCGAAPLTMDLIKAFSNKFPGVFLYQGYGMTETTGAAFNTIGPEEYRRWGSVGRLLTNCEAKIVDVETGMGLGPGKSGELWIRGPTVMKGYAEDVRANSEALVGGEGEGEGEGRWLRTGDLCCIDDEGFMFVVGRVKELIKYKGYQVAPAELEQLLLSHPDITDAAVIPYPDKEAGELPLAFVVRRPNSNIHQGQVIDFIGQQVAPYKKIRRVEFINSIPKSTAGKILRRELHKLTSSFSKL